MRSKNQFQTSYDKCVYNIKQIKNSNDMINKSIGITNQANLFRDVQRQKAHIEKLLLEVEDIVNGMQKSYMDPDSARKIIVIRQQLRVQKARRQQLLSVIPQPTFQPSYKNDTKVSKANANNKNKQNKFSTPSTTTLKLNPSSQQVSTYEQSLQKKQLAYQQKYLKQRSKQLKQTQQQLISINQVLKQTQNLAYLQGEKIDIIGEQLLAGKQNVELGTQELKQANYKSNKWAKKYKILAVVVIIVVGIALALTFLL